MIAVTENIHKHNFCYCQMLQLSRKRVFFFLCGVGWSLKINAAVVPEVTLGHYFHFVTDWWSFQ
jgi:hypothetical protein